MIGKQFTTRNSGVCVITKYVGCNEVHIKFLDTSFERVTDMNSLSKGQVKDTSLSKTVKKYEVGKEDIVGKTFENNKGQKYVVLEKISTTKFNIKFVDSGYETTVNKISIEIGSIKGRPQVKGGSKGGLLDKESVSDLFEIVDNEVRWNTCLEDKRAGKPVLNKHKAVSIYGRVYHFEDVEGLVLGVHKEISPQSKASPEGYETWNAMQKRCKDRGYHISDVFSKYETWVEWAKTQKGYGEKDFFSRKFNLDSDLFSQQTKTYSESTCVFIPMHLNQIYKTSYKGNHCLGVDMKNGKYRARINLFNTQVLLGLYDTQEEAIKVYRNKRAEYIKVILDLHRHQLDDKTIKFIEDDISEHISI